MEPFLLSINYGARRLTTLRLRKDARATDVTRPTSPVRRAAAPSRRHIQFDPAGGIPAGSLEVWEVRNFRQRTLVSSSNYATGLRRHGLDTGALEQVGELLAGVEHPGLHRCLRNADDLAGLFDRLLVIVDEVDDLAVRR